MPDLLSISMIQYGLYFGECIGYCKESISITPETIVYKKQSNIPSNELPDRIIEINAPLDLWTSLSRAIDWNRILALPDRLGDPDAADQGGEYVEITVSGETKRVDFERGATIAELAPLLKILHSLRTNLSSQMGEQTAS
jgi:hypothetical protein